MLGWYSDEQRDRVDDRAALTRFRIAEKQEVLLPDRRGTNGILDQVVVYLKLAVINKPRQLRP